MAARVAGSLTARHVMMTRVRITLLVCGALLFFGLLMHIGPKAVMTTLSRLSWRLPAILVFPACLVTALDALGWRFAFRRDRVPFRTLLGARLAGEAFNILTPTASVGGEPVKAWLIRPYVGLAESVPSLIVAKTTHTIGQVVFLALSLIVASLTLAPSSALLLTMRWLLAVEIVGVGGLVAVQLLGSVGATGRLIGRLTQLAGRLGTLETVDRNLVDFYRHARGRLTVSIAAHLGGWMLGVLETYLILRGLHVSVSLAEANVIEAFGIAIGFATFLVPARLGAMEAANVAALAALGLSAPAAVALALVQRLREALWTGIGVSALLVLRPESRMPALKVMG